MAEDPPGREVASAEGVMLCHARVAFCNNKNRKKVL